MNNQYLWSFIVLVASVLTNISLVNGEVVSSASATKTIPTVSTVSSASAPVKTLPTFTFKSYTAVPFITYPTTKTPPATTKSLYNFSVENPPVVKSVKTVPFVKKTKILPSCLVNGTTTYNVKVFKTAAQTYYCKGLHKRTVTTGKTIPSEAIKTDIVTTKTFVSNVVYGAVPSNIIECLPIHPVGMEKLRSGAQIFTSKTTKRIPDITTVAIETTSVAAEVTGTTETTTVAVETTVAAETTEAVETTIPAENTVILTSTTKSLPNVITVTEKITQEVTVTDRITVTNEVTVTVNQCSCSSVPTSTSSNCSEKYEQCGGKYFDGPTCCKSGKCQKINEYYSQCA